MNITYFPGILKETNMPLVKNFGVVFLAVFLLAVTVSAQDAPIGSVELKISGPGAIDDTTIKAGEQVSFDYYFSNDTIRRGISVGFEIVSEDIKTIIHVPDTINGGITDLGDIKGFNGWENKSVFDFTGVLFSSDDWNGELPDTAGFVGIVLKKRWQPQPMQKQISVNVIIPEPGTITIDSTFFPPGGDWMFDNEQKPGWGGPYTFKVVK